MKLDNKILTLAVVAGVGLYLLRGQLKTAAKAVNPVSRDNIFYEGVNAIGDVLDDGNSDNDSFSFGSAIYELFHKDPEI